MKLRAVNHPKLSHLVDCLVFATVARPGHKAAPSMSSGGDLDGNILFHILKTRSLLMFFLKGDEFFVTWDKDIIPSRVLEVNFVFSD